MNLATARSANRAREVGLRKVVGAQKPQLMKQFLGESFFYAVLAGKILAGGRSPSRIRVILVVAQFIISIGVVKDFHLRSLHYGIVPLVLLVAWDFSARRRHRSAHRLADGELASRQSSAGESGRGAAV